MFSLRLLERSFKHKRFFKEVVMTISEKSDSQLLDGIKRRDSAAFEEIVNRYQEKVFRLALHITKHQEDAEDVIQDTFLKVFSKIYTFRNESSFSSWLFRIAANSALMKLRSRNRRLKSELTNSTATGVETAIAICNDYDLNYASSSYEIRNVLQKATDSLPADYKIIFILRDMDNLSNQEISEAMNITVASVKSKLHRARLRLRKKLHNFYEDYKSPEIIFYKEPFTEQACRN